MLKLIATTLILFFSIYSYANVHNNDIKSCNIEKSIKSTHIIYSTEDAYTLADKYLNSKGVEMDIQKAFLLFKYAADNGHSKAQFDLGKMYEFWTLWNEKSSPIILEKIIKFFDSWNKSWYLQKSFELYLQSAKQGYGEAISEVGISYYEGKGTPINIKEAYYWFLIGSQTNEYLSTLYLKNIHKDLTTFQIDEIKKRIKK